jgi:hypothetical protein
MSVFPMQNPNDGRVVAAGTTPTRNGKGFAASIATGLSGLGRRRQPGKRAGRRQRPGYRPAQVAGGVAELEQRCLLSHITLSHHAHTASVQPGRIVADQAPAALVFPNLPAAGTSQNDETAVMNMPTSEIATAEPVTITNNYTSTVYPILSGINAPSNNGKPYDPYDPSNQEYRIYVGYSDATGNHVGLQPGQSITFNLPPALWDGGRIDIVTDTPLTEQSFFSSGNPFNYDPNALTYVQPVANNGVLLLYHSTATPPSGIATDAPSQVAEYAIRNTITTPNLLNSVDVDVQYIDALYLPVAVEVRGNANVPTAQTGWVGSINDVTDFQNTLKSFASGSLLNGYFGGAGWPEQLLSNTGTNDPNALVKLQGAYNLVALSASPSSFNPNLPYATSSQTTGNLAGTPGNNVNYAARAIDRLFFSWAEFYQQHFKGTKNYLAPTPELKAILNTGLTQANVAPFTIKTSGPQDLARAKAFSQTVWYALWAFSQDPNLNTNLRYITDTGTTTQGSTTLSKLSPKTVSELKNVVGVVGPNLLPRTQVNNPASGPPSATSIQLNQPATGTTPARKQDTYRFYYDTLASSAGGVPTLSAVSQLVGYILGDNVADLANVPGFTTMAEQQAVTENTIIPLLHGVPSPTYPQSDWYPTPGDPTTNGVAKYNLDPQV